MESGKILIVDDEVEILNMIKLVLQKEGFLLVETCTTGKEAIKLIETNRYDLIILDVMLPDMYGYDISSTIRKNSNAPIFFISARNSDLDKLTGFTHGGDDYITKPFNPLEVAARVRVQIKRYLSTQGEKEEREIFDFGQFTLNTKSAELRVDDHIVPCSAQVYNLLLFFCNNPDRIFSKEQLYQQVWKDDLLMDDNTVMVHIRKIREKIEKNPSKPSFLLTIRGLGYKLVSGKRRLL
ncbi:response regulator transcription factor [Bacillus sp. BHET2]|uniref:response regulator transcription factor n=1 Tax=Bacillus sp. BHET2 TaxID=2583818 RepID=UPI00110F1421|nr:response regulator transcription factor [Bacillus sp. BHET2]TMU83457.1 response regulator transcription factor [Bacillus sp. BHET2]